MSRVTCFGIDPGLASLGWGVVAREGGRHAHLGDGTLHTKPTDGSDEQRAAALGREVRARLDAARPDVVALERWVFYPEAEPHQAHALGLVIGAVLAQLRPDTPLVLLRAVDLRTSLGLSKGSTKEDTRRRVEALLGNRGRSQHSADALGVAIVGAGRARPTPAAGSSPGAGARPVDGDLVEVALTAAQRAALGRALASRPAVGVALGRALIDNPEVDLTLAGLLLRLTTARSP